MSSSLSKPLVLVFLTFVIFLVAIHSGLSATSKKRFTGIEHYIRRNASMGFPYRPAIVSMQSRLCSDTGDGGPSYRYHNDTRRCYMVGDRRPCGELMAFTMIDFYYGTCDCDQSLRCGRPLIYWPEMNRCFYVNNQGPCDAGRWLVFGMNQNPICKPNKCKSESSKNPTNGTNFWFEHKRKCYKTGTQGYCKKGQVLINNWDSYTPTCSQNPIVSCSQWGGVQRTGCLPGMKADYASPCSRNPIEGKPGKYGEQDEMTNIYHLTLE